MSFRNTRNSLSVQVAAAVLLCGFQASAQVDPIPPPKTPGNTVTNQNATIGTVRVKASPDECWFGIGLNTKAPGSFINQTPGAQPCAAGGQPRVDQSYIWGIVPDGNTIWYGTTSNGQCITHGGLVTDPTKLTPYQTDSWSCEFQRSPYVPTPLPGQIGDFRPPRFYQYDRTTHLVKDITPKVAVSSGNPLGVDPTWQALRGARASIIIGGRYVVVGGPTLSNPGRLTFFVWDKTPLPAGSPGKWIYKTTIPGYDNIRRWVEVNGVAYAGVGLSSDGGGTALGGAVVRLTTNFSFVAPAPVPPAVIPTCPSPTSTAIPPVPPVITATCLTLTSVGNLDGEGAYLTAHDDSASLVPPLPAGSSVRLYISTWPKPGTAGVFMGPVIPAGGYTAANQLQWTKVWKAQDYEPDPAIATSWAGGAISSWGGYLWWGTMNVPWSGPGRWSQVYGKPATQEEFQVAAAKAWRSTSLFRAKTFSAPTPTVELLYGEAQFYKYTPVSGSVAAHWDLVDNVNHLVPLYGASGFDNTFNDYIWSMAVWNNKLYVGTMDWSYMAEKGTQVIGSPIPLTPFIPIVGGDGADLWVFSNTTSKAIPETITGYGNPTNYGIRNIVPIDSTHAFLTMSNAMNLLTAPGVPNGGWELIEISPRSTTVGGR